MDFTFTADEEVYRDEVRAWMMENKPDWSESGT